MSDRARTSENFEISDRTGPGPEKFLKPRTGPDQDRAKFDKLGPDRTRTMEKLKISDQFGPSGPRTKWSVDPWFIR